ncbi:MAG: DUF2905 domain-containing protein [Gammaproteobacteria bacterium]|nr:DUF2905 domain-containing protein [Gammaproteobacteria bacterium]MCF6362677.1 DUF2905 domain-containing protein [Gammaproteobacteria bacterium]
MNFPRLFIGLGIFFLAVGLLWPWLLKLGLGRLPGDIFIERGNVRFYFPLTTAIIVSLLLSLLFWLLRK